MFQTFMIYAPGTLSTADFEQAIAQDAAIVVIVNDETMNGTVVPPAPEERLKQDTRLITPELSEKMGARNMTINNNPAWVREAGDYGTQTVQFSNGTIVSQNPMHEPARLQLYIGNTDYIITGERSGADLIKIATSIK